MAKNHTETLLDNTMWYLRLISLPTSRTLLLLSCARSFSTKPSKVNGRCSPQWKRCAPSLPQEQKYRWLLVDGAIRIHSQKQRRLKRAESYSQKTSKSCLKAQELMVSGQRHSGVPNVYCHRRGYRLGVPRVSFVVGTGSIFEQGNS